VAFVLDPFQTIVAFNLGTPSTEDPPSEYEWVIRVGVRDPDPAGPFTVTFTSSVVTPSDLVEYVGSGEDAPESARWDLYGMKFAPLDTEGNPVYYSVQFSVSGSSTNTSPGIELQLFVDVWEGPEGPNGNMGVFETPFSGTIDMVPDGLGGWNFTYS
jgi:hypothetical protein